MPFTNPDTIHRASAGANAPYQWGDTVNDDLNYLYGDTGWTNVTTFTNGYTNAATFTTRYMLIGRIVFLNGAITGGTVATTAFTLPAGYRPSLGVEFATPQNNAFGVLTITNLGAVVPNTTGSNVHVTCSFPIV
jgi:hypothetical protein